MSDGYIKKSNLKNYCIILSLLHRGFGKTCLRESVMYNIKKAEIWFCLVWVVSYLCIFNATEMVISYFIFILCFYYCFNWATQIQACVSVLRRSCWNITKFLLLIFFVLCRVWSSGLTSFTPSQIQSCHNLPTQV